MTAQGVDFFLCRLNHHRRSVNAYAWQAVAVGSTLDLNGNQKHADLQSLPHC